MHKQHDLYDNYVDLQLVLIRIYIGLDFTHHFAEKFGLLGDTAYQGVIHYFASVGLSPTFVFIAGLCEFSAFVGFTFGLFTRVAAVGTALYLMISMYAGHHIQAGFTWANHVNNVMIDGKPHAIYGGWEYPLVWAFICLTFTLTGGRKWSLDQLIRMYLLKHPNRILKLLTH